MNQTARFITILLVMQQVFVFAQTKTQVLPYQTYLKMVLDNHPTIKQANGFSTLGKMEIRLARGMFDPKFEMDFTQKVYGGKQYYGYLDNGLKVPLWFGADVKAGYENNTGSQINPSDYTPKGGLEYLGLQVPIGQGMIIDDRRAAVKQAFATQQMNEAEKIKLINKLLFYASKEYWNWFLMYNKYNLALQAYSNANIRFLGISQRSKQGDLASIDSVEAFMTMQEREIILQNAKLELNNVRLVMSNYLWTADMNPLEADTTLVPDNVAPVSVFSQEELNKLLSNLENTSPELLKMNAKIDFLKIDKRNSADKLKPNIDFTAKYLTSPKNDLLNDLNWNYWQNHYKVMLTYSQPLFLRKERAKFQMSKVKLQQTEFEKLVSQREIHNETKAQYNELKNLENVFKQQQNILQNYKILLDGEKQRFENGESSVFMINSREMKLLEGQNKYFEMRAKLEKAQLELLYITGVLATQ